MIWGKNVFFNFFIRREIVRLYRMRILIIFKIVIEKRGGKGYVFIK